MMNYIKKKMLSSFRRWSTGGLRKKLGEHSGFGLIATPHYTWDVLRETQLVEDHGYLVSEDENMEEDDDGSDISSGEDGDGDKKKESEGDDLASSEEAPYISGDDDTDWEDDSEDASEEDESEEDVAEYRLYKERHRQFMFHNALFRLSPTYRVVRQLRKSCPNLFLVEHAVYGEAVLKIERMTWWEIESFKRHQAPPTEVRCLAKSVHDYVAKLLRWHVLQPEITPVSQSIEDDVRYFYAFITPRYREDNLALVVQDPRKVRKYMFQLMRTLMDLLGRGVFHRDLKPSNVLWDDQKESITIIDFNNATLDIHRNRCNIVGTSGFISPDMSIAYEYDCRSDVWSVGVIFGMLINGVSSETDVDEHLVRRWIGDAKATLKRVKNIKKKRKQRKLTHELAAQDLLIRMLDVNRDTRWDYEKCLKHSYFSGEI